MCQYHYRVYIIELKKTVLEDRHFLERNPWYEEGKPCVYVGSCVFQTKPATDSRRKLPPIPREACH